MRTALLSFALVACAPTHTNSADSEALAQLEALLEQQAKVDANLETFDVLDFEVFTDQQWDRLHESHADDILVHWPDGHTTEGIDVHIADLQAMFVWAPDTRIEVHPIRFGSGEFTAVTGVMEGTFSEPMPIGNEQYLEPTGQTYRIDMATIGKWTEEGNMSEEWLFWDNAEFLRQIGLGQ
ncbi:MAG: polyketide cyclase [Deltaproteobacteria bacterium]|nr:MAG: polyketide cyclase [Deltaproteobacteria bacterium]